MQADTRDRNGVIGNREMVNRGRWSVGQSGRSVRSVWSVPIFLVALLNDIRLGEDRKSTRLNSSHTVISYAVFCLKKKKEAGVSQIRATLASRRRRVS